MPEFKLEEKYFVKLKRCLRLKLKKFFLKVTQWVYHKVKARNYEKFITIIKWINKQWMRKPKRLKTTFRNY